MPLSNGEGGEGIVRVELDPERKRGGAEDIRSATAAILAPGDAHAQRIALSWTGEDTLEGRFPIQKTGIYLGAVDLGNNKVLPLSPLTLPYSPEFEPRQDPDEGRKTLAEMARITGGIDRTAWDDVFNASRLRDRQVRDLIIPLALMVSLLHIMEIGGRRLLLFARIRLPNFSRVPPTKVAPPVVTSPAAAPRTQTATGGISAVPCEGPCAWPNQPV